MNLFCLLFQFISTIWSCQFDPQRGPLQHISQCIGRRYCSAV